MLLEPVLTAHPTEAARRTFLQSQLRLGRLLDALDDPRSTPAERAAVEGALAEETTMLWQTDEVRSFRPTVSDEVRTGLWFFESSLFGAGAELARRWRQELPGLPVPLRFGTWIGGDQDGNPNATAAELLDALARARVLALRVYRDEVRELARALGVSDTLVGADAELLASIAARRASCCRASAEETGRRNATRALPPQADRHLAAAGQRAGRPRRAALRPRVGAPADLRLIDHSLRAHAGERIADGRLADLLARVDVFGLHVARLDVRVHADQVRQPDERLHATLRGRARAPRRGTASRRSTPSSSPARAARTTCVAAERAGRGGGLRRSASCRCSRRSTTSRAPRRSSPSCSTTRGSPACWSAAGAASR